jgi:hypothetical protein
VLVANSLISWEFLPPEQKVGGSKSTRAYQLKSSLLLGFWRFRFRNVHFGIVPIFVPRLSFARPFHSRAVQGFEATLDRSQRQSVFRGAVICNIKF